MTAVLPVEQAPSGRTIFAAAGWRTHLVALGLVAAAILLFFRRDAAGMAEVWLGSATFNHCMLILPIVAWLVWQRLPELRPLAPWGWAPGLLVVAAGAFLWLLGEAGTLALARQLGLVLMLQGAVIACLGREVSRGLLFPLFYAFFLVPFGDQLVPPLQTVTAETAMLLLGLVGLPAHMEGVFITTPTGYFEVAEACSGIQFLIAMVALGALVANVCFRSWKRRALFMLAALLIPIIANGIRAWAIIYIAHHTGVEFAASVDHVVFGWVFFGIVIALVLAAGWPFFDRRPGEPWIEPGQFKARPRTFPVAGIAAAAAAMTAVPLAWSASTAAAEQPVPAAIELPQVHGWKSVGASGRPWRPHYAGADLVRTGRYRDASGREIDLILVLFARQAEGRELVGFRQGPIEPNDAWAWAASGPAPAGGRLDRIVSHGTVREVATFYRVGSILTGSPSAVKWETMKVRLLGGRQAAVAVLVSAEAPGEGLSPRPAIDAFLRDLGSIEKLADSLAAGSRR